MTREPVLFTVAMILFGQFGFAQDNPPADDWKSASSNQPGKAYPQVNSEGRIRFRIVAPEAQNVTVSFRDSSPFTKGADGAWVGYTRPLDEGFHYYTIKIDGAEVPDPNSMFFFGANRWGSGVEIPARDQDFYAVKNVPHGQLREVLFFSKSTDSTRRAFVYTPPGYEQESGPTLSGLVSPARLGRKRIWLGCPRPRQFDHGQPDRGEQNQAVYHRDDVRDDE